MHRIIRGLIVVSAAWAAFGLASPASASIIEFYEGNNCTQKKLGGLNMAEHLTTGADNIVILSRDVMRMVGIPVSNKHPWNDEARSARISSNWRNQREPRTGAVVIYDSPQASKNDDWAWIVIRDVTQIPPEGICIGSFERNFDSGGVYLERYPHNGLDGKISYIRSHCDAACRANLTPDPNAVEPKPKVIIRRTPTPTPPKVNIKRAPSSTPTPKVVIRRRE